jgi:beta-lactamase class A
MREQYRIKILLIIVLFLGFSAGLFAGIKYCKVNNKDGDSEIIRTKGYKFISPLLDYELKPELKNTQIIILERAIKKIIEEKLKENKAIYISVYFRDMLNGPWFGINQDETFAPASLLKVPLMIAYLKYAELYPLILSSGLVYNESDMPYELTQNILPREHMENGKSYTIEDLIYRMIAYSDNASKDMLLSNIDKSILDEVYTDLGIIVPDIRGMSDFITVKEYSSFFRILFNASYLNNPMSEKALEILSQSTFKTGIVAGVPEGVDVAHKFAERGDAVNQTFQLHDCGIVYHKDRPYILCVMTYGRDFEALTEIIKNISSEVYKSVDNYYKKDR